jgi:TrmH family RNA methyltransferase
VYQPLARRLYNQFLLTQPQRDCFDIVLVSPRNPLNIGAAARAMANFACTHLTVVAPYEAHWREAKSAVQADNILQTARNVETLQSAIVKCTLVLGTGTSTRRKPAQPVVSLPNVAPVVQQEIARGGRVALIFGSEKRGLTRDDLSLCHRLVEIPTDPGQPSMNLGQAVAVCLYELSARHQQSSIAGEAPDPNTPAKANPLATARDLDLLSEVVEKTLAAANYSPSAMRDANRHDLQLLLRRLSLTRHDERRILGVFRRILWQLQRLSRHTSIR